ncbi:hypothetical protein Tdes44962_MAKER10506 [Teratosphaeria destructans]|uniref:Uncharacterized protein n=1 Tax=Teratosphaeria destructans TaxID=418781 RepID=A0A9W7T0A3_9PEZI|nr:hypothetical protein Tdes44962_MAKER10506 [Teratosphaeria destructans]
MPDAGANFHFIIIIHPLVPSFHFLPVPGSPSVPCDQPASGFLSLCEMKKQKMKLAHDRDGQTPPVVVVVVMVGTWDTGHGTWVRRRSRVELHRSSLEP